MCQAPSVAISDSKYIEPPHLHACTRRRACSAMANTRKRRERDSNHRATGVGAEPVC